MALILADSFDHYAYADIASKWTQVSSGFGDTSTVTTVGRRSTNGLRLSQDGSSNRMSKRLHVVPVDPAPSGATMILGMAFRCVTAFAAGPTLTDSEGTGLSAPSVIWALRSAGTTLCWANLNANGTISVYRATTLLGTTSAALVQNVYMYLEFKVLLHASAGTVTVKFDGASVLALTGQNTTNGGAVTVDELRLGPTASGSVATEWNVDDLYFADGSGSDITDFLGDVRVDVLTVSGAGNSAQFTPLSGSNYQNVDETAADGDTTYNESLTVGHIDTFVITNIPVASAVVKAIQVVCQVRKTDAGAVGHKAVVRIGATNYKSAEQNPTSGHSFLRSIWEKSPATAIAWTDTEVNGAEAGYEKSS